MANDGLESGTQGRCRPDNKTYLRRLHLGAHVGGVPSWWPSCSERWVLTERHSACRSFSIQRGVAAICRIWSLTLGHHHFWLTVALGHHCGGEPEWYLKFRSRELIQTWPSFAPPPSFFCSFVFFPLSDLELGELYPKAQELKTFLSAYKQQHPSCNKFGVADISPV
jgi:hypothetical protein